MDDSYKANAKAMPSGAGPSLRIDPQFEPPRATYNIPLQGVGILATAAFVLSLLGISLVVMMYFKQKDNVPVPLHFPAPGAGLKALPAAAPDIHASSPSAVRQ